jgi:hypothetical protein
MVFVKFRFTLDGDKRYELFAHTLPRVGEYLSLDNITMNTYGLKHREYEVLSVTHPISNDLDIQTYTPLLTVRPR